MGSYLIYQDQTQGTPVHPSTSTLPQVIKTWTLDQSDAFLIQVTAVIRITAAAGTAQTVNPTITIGANTLTFPISQLATHDDYLTAVFLAESRAGDVVTVQLNSSAGADANTSVNVYSLNIMMVGP